VHYDPSTYTSLHHDSMSVLYSTFSPMKRKGLEPGVCEYPFTGVGCGETFAESLGT